MSTTNPTTRERLEKEGRRVAILERKAAGLRREIEHGESAEDYPAEWLTSAKAELQEIEANISATDALINKLSAKLSSEISAETWARVMGATSATHTTLDTDGEVVSQAEWHRPATITVEVNFTRDESPFLTSDRLKAYGVTASNGADRGLMWIEAEGQEPRIIRASEFRTLYPEADRRSPFPETDETTARFRRRLEDLDG